MTESHHSRQKKVLVTGANGYIGNAVAKAFSRAGWQTFGLLRRAEDAADLARHEIFPLIGTPGDRAFLRQADAAAFDVIVSNTEDWNDVAGHLVQVGAMLDELGQRSLAAGVRPLVLFTSGCKDYGPMVHKHGDAGLAPHTESSPMNVPAPLSARERFGSALLARENAPWDAIVLRPTIVYGYASSHYGPLFELAAASEGTLRLIADPQAIMHSLHVDDCAEAYVQLAEHPDRQQVANQAYNISNAHYETAREIGTALAASYGLALEFTPPTGDVDFASVHGLANFWQWVGSDKLRDAIGWQARRPTFVDGLAQYRLAWEAHSKKTGR